MLHRRVAMIIANLVNNKTVYALSTPRVVCLRIVFLCLFPDSCGYQHVSEPHIEIHSNTVFGLVTLTFDLCVLDLMDLRSNRWSSILLSDPSLVAPGV